MGLFTKENAAKYGAIGGKLSGISKFEALKRQAQQTAIAEMETSYEGKTLLRVRIQLDRLYEAFMSEVGKRDIDAAKLDRIAAAQSRLAEQERQLAGRPLPGSLKPTSPKSKRASQPDGTPLD